MINEERLWDALRRVNDPEFPISVVDMGLILGIQNDDGHVKVDVTFTAMGCPAMDMILDDVRSGLLKEEGVTDVRIEILWDPPWSRSRLSEAGKTRLRAMGIAV